jgi:UDP-glucose 4-epimerase
MTGEEYCRLFDRLFNVPTVILRYFNVYGPRQPQTGTYALVMGIFLNRVKNKQPLVIHGDGAQRRDFIHVRDVVNANIMAFESSMRDCVFNIGNGSSVSIKELADMISANQTFGPRREGDAVATLADIGRARTLLGWKPEVPLIVGVNEMKERVLKGLEDF